MKNSNKKGFTLVELLVVIAILAILATVAVVGYTSFINKADESADIHAVRQMNTVLEANIEKPETILEVSALLKANGFNVEDGIVPLYEGRSFYWYRPANRMVYVNEENGKFELVFPENISGFPSAKNDDCQTMPTVDPDVALTVPSVPADVVYSFVADNNVTTLPTGVTVPDNLATFEDTIDWINTFDDNVTGNVSVTCKVNGATKNGILLDSDVKLTEDVILDLAANASTLNINIAGNVTIDLNGHKLIQKADDGRSVALFTVRAGATLNIVDSSADQTGAICASYAFQIDAGATVNLYSGSVIIPESEYRNTADYESGAQLVFVYGGTFNMYGGKLDATVEEGNIHCAIGNGYASNSATVNLYAGEIIGEVYTTNIPNYENYGATITK